MTDLPADLPEHGALLRLHPRRDLGALEVVLDIGRALLHVLRDDGRERWEGRVLVDAHSRAAWDRRLMELTDGEPVEEGIGELVWRVPLPSGDRVGRRALATLRTRARAGGVAFARDLCAVALRSRLDHPLAVQALAQWNELLNFAATVQFADGSPRRVRLQGIVDPAGLANLSALTRVLRPDEPLIVDLQGCASLGSWDPAELLARNTVAWVAPVGGIADHLVDIGVPREALHDTERAARAWLRG